MSTRHITAIADLSLTRGCIILCAVLLSLCAQAQQPERSHTREGNKQFEKGKYADAEASYKKALEAKNNFPEAIFNLGDAIYQQKRYDDATKQFELAAKLITDPKQKAQSYHNLGNSQMEKQEYQQAVDAYRKALQYNPRDKDTKYNLAYANEKLRAQNQNQKNDKNKQNKDNKNQKDNKDQNKDQNKDNKDNKDKNDQQKKDQNQNKDGKGDKDKDSQAPKPKPGQISKEQAEKLLEALKAEEQKAQEKMQKKTAKPQDVKIAKDW